MLQAEQILQERYQLQEKLGRTAAGRQTWLAKDLQLNEEVIVKLLAFSPQMQWEELKLFEREAQVLQNLNHPRIPRYRDYFSLDRETGSGLPWFGLVQDYIPGASIQEFLEQGKHFTETQVKKIATQILNILIYLHELSPPVLHRDIKPSNLIWGEDEQVYLVDFGAVQDKGTFTGVSFTVVGTSGYAPLEQFWGRAVPTSDLYALGATLIHLLTGIAPADLPQKDSRIQFANQVSVSSNFVTWIEKLTEIAIEKRFPNAQQALKALEYRLAQTPPVAKSRGLRKILKPDYTRIKINKSAERLKIYIPQRGGWFSITIFMLIEAYLLYTTVVLIISSTSFVILSIIFTALIAVFIIYSCEQTHIYFDRNRFKLNRQTLRFTYGLQEGYVADILGVFLLNKSQSFDVSIRTSNRTYQLCRGLSDVESAWLAQEIQDWLNSR
ncbi:serine/threonine protein kinase [Argonema antarcticum]|uniref:serine/threonine protein kinase n=1 Tax=Argonema antarcticum TaxID=2942763 RepID=UPI00201346CD|nr:serine/threonine-protein kinase [Argonema antarcticum]MCL1473231.1 serine/threonine protein kinase [Argonema antarcticum A004/B2]